MKINVQTQTGLNFPLDVDPSDTVEEIKYRLHDERGIPPDSQKLVYLEKELLDRCTLASYKIGHNANLWLAFSSPDGSSLIESAHFMPSTHDLGVVKRSWGLFQKLVQSVRGVRAVKFFKWRSCFSGGNTVDGNWREADQLVMH